MKIYMKVDSAELGEALKSIKAWDGRTRLEVENVMKRGTKDVRREAVQRVAKRSGKLKKSLKTRFRASKCEGQVYTKVPYAHILEYGAKGHEIKARNKKALHFMQNGEHVFAQKVKVPRFLARPYLKPAYDYVVPDIIMKIRKAVRKS